MELIKAIKERRSIRRFKKKKLPIKIVRRIIEAATYAPTACNKQLYEFVIVDKKEIKNKLVEEAGAVEFFRNAPVIVYALYSNRVTKENYANYQSAAAAVQNMLLYAHSIGIGACWSSACGDRDKLRKILEVSPYMDIICAIPMGYPDEKPKMPPKKKLDHMIHYNKFTSRHEKYDTKSIANWTLKQLEEFRTNGVRATSPAVDIKHALGPISLKAFKNELDIVQKYAKGKILDVLGFAGLYTIEFMRRHIQNIYTYDVSEEILNFMEERRRDLIKKDPFYKSKIAMKKSSLNKIPYQKNTFDTITWFNNINYNPKPEMLLKEINRVMKKDGNLLIGFVNKYSSYGLAYYYYTKILGNLYVTNEGLMKPLSLLKVAKMLKKTGFKLKTAYGLGMIPERLGDFGLANTKSKILSPLSSFVVVVAKKQ
ncbi:MAG: nitroreductase family protein [Candidatus Woesearchaeota archaeon]|nr:MAG: nitroreductase family protein [Candidatus Woesearchaeota archaeon]